MANINDILTDFFNNELKKQRIYSEIATVISVDEDNMTAEVSFISSNAEKTVRLGATISEDSSALTASSVLLLPVVDSKVIVTFINETTGFVSSVTDVSKILYQVGDRYIQVESDFIEMDGNADFMVRFNAMESAMDSLNTFLNAEYAKIAAGIATGGGSYTPGTADIDISGAKIEEIKTS